MAKKPTIAVTGPERGGLIAWLMTALAIRRCGGEAIRVTPATIIDDKILDGLIIGGGTDVDPFHYGEVRTYATSQGPEQGSSIVDWIIGLLLSLFRVLFATGSRHDYDPDRDTLERNLIQYALYEGLPVLGICRGAQLMNVALGGTLHQSIEHFYDEDSGNVRSILPRKRIGLAPNSRLHEILQTESCVVNALHDQSIEVLGEGVTVSATEESGVIQAIECGEHSFFIGVQWHPEYMPQSRNQLKLFQGLLHSAARVKRAQA